MIRSDRVGSDRICEIRVVSDMIGKIGYDWIRYDMIV